MHFITGSFKILFLSDYVWVVYATDHKAALNIKGFVVSYYINITWNLS